MMEYLKSQLGGVRRGKWLGDFILIIEGIMKYYWVEFSLEIFRGEFSDRGTL